MKPFNVFPYDSNIDFMRLRWVSLAVAFLLMVVALGAIGFKGFNFALDFTGGVGVELRYAKPPDVDAVLTPEIRAQLADVVAGLGLGPNAGFDDVINALRARSGALTETEAALLFLDEWRKQYGKK